jgi:hypothetical protein
MPVKLDKATDVGEPLKADEWVITGFEVYERDVGTGDPLDEPVGVVHWVALLDGEPVHRASTQVPAEALRRASKAKPDATKSVRENIKASLYRVMQDAGVFPAGKVE